MFFAICYTYCILVDSEKKMRLVSTTDDLAGYYRDKSVAAPLEGMSETGFKHIDLSMYGVIYDGSPWIKEGDEWKKEIGECKKIADKWGFDFCQAHAPSGSFFGSPEKREQSLLATKRSIEACAILGIPHVVVHAEALGSSLLTKWLGRKKFEQKNVELFRIFAEEGERYGVDILVENSSDLWNRGYFLNTGKDIRAFVDKVGSTRVGVCWDTGHANCQGADQYKEITAIGDKIKAIHAQDNYGNGDSHVMPMAGTINWDQVMRALKDVGYQGDFTFEGGNTLRRAGCWPNYRREVKKTDLLADPPLYIQQKQLAVMYEVGKWMVEKYGFVVE